MSKRKNKKPWQNKLERILYSYPALQAAIANDVDLFPSITQSYNDMPGSGSISNSTEAYGIKRAEKIKKVEAIERGINSLTTVEREIITEKYFMAEQLADYEVMRTLNIAHWRYYKLKDQALHKMALALNII